MEYKEILKNIENLDEYEKSDLIIDIFKTVGSFNQLDIIQYTTQQIFNKSENYEILYTLLEDIQEQIKTEYKKECTKDDGYYNVKANKLEKDYTIIQEFYNKFYNNIC